jgi:two-component system sensor histidine kinase/response regulator
MERHFTMPNVKIMLVDDEPRNLDVLAEMLAQRDNEVLTFPNGRSALKAGREERPDLMLLDICMPDMDGFEVCRRLKQSADTKDIPVIFLSALDDTNDKVCGFEAGAVDYITKPLQVAEVLARVDTHVQLRQYQTRLEDMLEERSAKLLEANRRLRTWNRAKSDWLNVIAHEMRTPLNGICSLADLVFDGLATTEELRELKPEYTQSRERIQTLIDDASLLVSLDVGNEEFTPASCQVNDVLAAAVASIPEDMKESTNIQVEPAPEQTINVADANLLERCVGHLLFTAVQCVEENGTIQLFAEHGDNNEAVIVIRTSGPRLPDEDFDTFFEVGGQKTLVRGGGDFGLRPALAKKLIELFHGKLNIKNKNDNGIVITARLPRAT